MNTSARFEPVPPLPMAARTVVHASTRSTVSVNSDADGGAMETLVRSQHLEMVVWKAGALLVRFCVQQAPARGIARGMVSSRR